MDRILMAAALSLIVLAAASPAEAKGKKANNTYPKNGIVFTCFDGGSKCGNWNQPAPAKS
jgi:hypothetical protein